MSWTAQQVAENIASYRACPEGLVWAQGKDSDTIWASEDTDAVPYLIWWAIQNAGQKGWKSPAEIITVLEALVSLGSIQPVYRRILADRLSKVQTQFIPKTLHFYSQLEFLVGLENSDALRAFRLRALPLVKAQLEPAI